VTQGQGEEEEEKRRHTLNAPNPTLNAARKLHSLLRQCLPKHLVTFNAGNAVSNPLPEITVIVNLMLNDAFIIS
jgi:hypothetical protein